MPSRKVLLLSIAVPTLATGAWAAVAPSSWYENFPGFGRDWVPAFGPYNEHFVRDFAGALFALGVLLAWAAFAPNARLRRLAPGAFLIWSLPHFVYHLAHIGDLQTTGDEIANAATNALSVAIPLALLLIRDDDRAPRMRAPAKAPDGWRLSPAPDRGLVRRLAYRVSRRRYGHVLGPIAVHGHSPMLLSGYAGFELALERAPHMDRRLSELAATGAANMTGCPFCIDFASGLLPTLGIAPEKVRDLPNWRESDAYDEDERLVLEYAEAMTATPVQVPDELFERLRARFSEPEIVELTASIALENYRGRFNHALGLGSEGFCERPAAGNGRPAEVVA